MGHEPNEEIYEALANQSLGRPLEPDERALAAALDVIFGSGEHDFDTVARSLQAAGVERPSGESGPWTASVLDDELKSINASLDRAYGRHG